MARHYRTLLESVLADPHGRIDDLAMLPEEERQALVAAAQGPRELLDGEPVPGRVGRAGGRVGRPQPGRGRRLRRHRGG